MMQFGLQNQNQSFFNNFTDNNSFADNSMSGLFNTGGLHTGSALTSLGSSFTNSPAVQTFGNIGAGSSYGVTQNINYTQPNSSIASPFSGYGGFGGFGGLGGFGGTGNSVGAGVGGLGNQINPFTGFPQAQVPGQQLVSTPGGYVPASGLPMQYPPQSYYQPQQPQYPQQPGYPQQGGGGNSGGMDGILGSVMQMMMMMISTFMQNGSFIGSQFGGDVDYHGPNGDHDHGGGVDEGPYEEVIVEEEILVDNGRVWGDPHFVGAEGGKFDVMGDAGKIYNILSDKDLQFNAQFDEWKGQADATIMSHAGLTIGKDQIEYGVDGKLLINGEEMTEDGSYLGGKVVKKGDSVTITTGEWNITLKDNGDHLNYDFKSGNAGADGVMPHGLFGQTADGDGKARTGDTGKGAQGGGAIEKVDGTTTEKGDKETYKEYEVTGLFDTDFDNFNKFYHRANPNAPKPKAKVTANAKGGGEPE